MTTKRRHTVRLCSRQGGMTLAEMTVVIAIAALMVGLTIPAANMLLNSFESQSGAKSTISAALASARAIAAKEQRYAGIRFQKCYNPANPIEASQYIIFIIQDPNMDHAYGFGFRAVEGIQPVKLPDSIGVMDMIVIPGADRKKQNPVEPYRQYRIDDNGFIDSYAEVTDSTTFAIVFSPSGKLVIHGVWVRNKNGISDYPTYSTLHSNDDIFNKKGEVDAGLAMFYQDDYFADNTYPDLGLGPEPSRNSFVIYETKLLKQTNYNRRWTDCLSRLKPVFINPYTGTIINDK